MRSKVTGPAIGLVPTGFGLIVGIGASLLLSRLVESFLYDVAPTDPGTYATTIGSMIAVALLATFLPARAAAAVDPVKVLKVD